MKSALLLALVGVVTGALGAGLVATLHDDVPVTSDVERADVVALQTKLGDVEAQQAQLVQRVRELELAAMMIGDERVTTRQVVEPVSVDDGLESDLLAAATQAAREDVAKRNEELPALVSEAVAQLREQEEAQRKQQREDARSKLLDDQIAKLTEELNLSYYQAEEMRRILTDQGEARTALIEEVRASGNWPTMRPRMGELRDATNTELGTVLSASQLEGYQNSESGGAAFGGRGGFFGRGGGGGGGTDAAGGGSGGSGG